ncbi:MAG: histidine phosphatase family protein [Anaeromyxobacter sp.]
MSTIVLVRHGQASFDAEDYDQLSELGIEQARRTGQALGGRVPGLEAVYVGTLRRQQQTAEHCLAALGGAPQPVALPGLDEFDHREILLRYEPRYAERTALVADLVSTGDPRRAFQELFSAALARWTCGAHDAEYGLPWPGFQRRSLAALEQVASALGRSRTALVFSSAGPITAICQGLLGLTDDAAGRLAGAQVNCGISKVIRSERGLMLSSFNDHAHLEGEARLISYR